MASTAALPIPEQTQLLDADRRDGLGLLLSASLPLAVFVIANGVAQLNGAAPLFFSPFGLPGWVGAGLHLGALPLFGVARWMVAGRGEAGRRAGHWLVGLMAGTIVFPFIVTPLDSLMLSMVSLALMLTGISAAIRVNRVSKKAGLMMLPGMLWLGFSALIGLTFAAAWSPPFALTHSHSA